MKDEFEDLADHLNRAIPEPPDTSAWADQVRGKVKQNAQRRNIGAAFALVLVVGGGVVVTRSMIHQQPVKKTVNHVEAYSDAQEKMEIPVAQQDDHDSLSAQTDLSADSRTESSAAQPGHPLCDQITRAEPAGDEISGATLVEAALCDGGDASLRTPLDSLSSPDGLRAFANTYNALPSLPESVVCDSGDGPSYTIVLRHRDGRLETILGELSECQEANQKQGADHLVQVFTEQLVANRNSSNQKLRDNLCNGPQDSWVPVTPDDLVEITNCSNPTSKLTEAEWQVLQNDLKTSVRNTDSTQLAYSAKVFVGQTKYGDSVAMHWDGNIAQWKADQAGNLWVWTPSSAAKEVLNNI